MYIPLITRIRSVDATESVVNIEAHGTMVVNHVTVIEIVPFGNVLVNVESEIEARVIKIHVIQIFVMSIVRIGEHQRRNEDRNPRNANYRYRNRSVRDDERHNDNTRNSDRESRRNSVYNEGARDRIESVRMKT